MSQENLGNQQPLIRYINRQQMAWRAVDVERLIGEDHPGGWRALGAWQESGAACFAVFEACGF
ncbi:MAG TPA: hypothetical protein VGI46_12070 [Candidatus Acidoferrum sp.]|jgi:hypothetical protein